MPCCTHIAKEAPQGVLTTVRAVPQAQSTRLMLAVKKLSPNYIHSPFRVTIR